MCKCGDTKSSKKQAKAKAKENKNSTSAPLPPHGELLPLIEMKQPAPWPAHHNPRDGLAACITTLSQEGESQEGESLKDHVMRNCALVPLPVLSQETLEQLMDQKHLFGHQKKKSRGTLQSDRLDEMEEGENELGEFIYDLRAAAVGDDGCLINDFVNIHDLVENP